MTRYVRIFMIVLLAAFAAGTVAHAAGSAKMTMKMAFVLGDGTDIGDCKDCLDDKNAAQQCDNVCISPILAVEPLGQFNIHGSQTTAESPVLQSVTGRTGLPEPYPPRSIFLS
ncbi:hypothetical protein ACP90_27780 (plasmid) [Labrenzia sp. CP4]|jgi:hypothetical protein|nr:hypothetical protein ACP90_27780 [Labrenzia sp. CP4]